MPDNIITREQLIQELAAMRQRIAELEAIDTKYQHLQAEYKENVQKFQTLFEHSGDSIFMVEPVTLDILDANSNAARRLGYGRDELLRLKLRDIEIIADDIVPETLARISSVSGTRFYECYHRRKNGSLMPVEVSSRLGRYGSAQIMVIFVRDISQRKRFEADREQLISDLDAFAHTVAHDLKAPLGMVIGYADILLDDFKHILDEEAYEYVRTIAHGGEKMRNIIDELLLFASVRRLDEVDLKPLDMARIVDEALRRLRLLIDRYQAEIKLPDRESWPVALGYAPWVEEVWANYISNAIKYGGTPPRVDVGATVQNNSTVCCWVRDNGPGISLEEQVQLFQQFTRLDEARAQGHGLGLSIVQRIVEKLGGQVSIESVVGQGSVFSFTLPTAD